MFGYTTNPRALLSFAADVSSQQLKGFSTQCQKGGAMVIKLLGDSFEIAVVILYYKKTIEETSGITQKGLKADPSLTGLQLHHL